MIDADGVSFKDVRVETEKGYPYTFYNTQNLSLADLEGISEEGTLPVKILGKKSSRVEVTGMSTDQITIGDQVPEGAVTNK